VLDSRAQQQVSGMDLDIVDDPNRELILIVEDNADTNFLLKQILILAGFNVIGAMNGKEAIKKASEYNPAIILLDLMMPDMDGWETLQYLRKMGDIPVIIISAKENKDEIVDGFRKGIDDYITKPFYNAEVIERVKAVLRRKATTHLVTHLVYPAAGLEIDFHTQEVRYHKNSIRLTPREFAVFTVIAKQAPNLVSYATIMDTVWGENTADARKRMKYLVYLIRKKLEQIAPDKEYLQNVDRLGYCLLVEQ
jgi:DNA-binding response OmpR family regulator